MNWKFHWNCAWIALIFHDYWNRSFQWLFNDYFALPSSTEYNICDKVIWFLQGLVMYMYDRTYWDTWLLHCSVFSLIWFIECFTTTFLHTRHSLLAKLAWWGWLMIDEDDWWGWLMRMRLAWNVCSLDMDLLNVLNDTFLHNPGYILYVAQSNILPSKNNRPPPIFPHVKIQ